MPIYPYVGEETTRQAAARQPGGIVVESRADLARWLAANREGLAEGATFVVDRAGRLRLAPRRSEHVACAGGGPVLAAGEMFFRPGAGAVTVVAEVSNLSTGYCPPPESWPAVAAVLDRLGVAYPGRFTTEVVFRRCEKCGERNVVKDGWLVCAVCGASLPALWNL